MRVNSGTPSSSLASVAALMLLFDDGPSCLVGVLAEVRGASYSTSVGSPNAVIKAGETMGEVYKFGSGSFSTAAAEGVLCFLLCGLLNVE